MSIHCYMDSDRFRICFSIYLSFRAGAIIGKQTSNEIKEIFTDVVKYNEETKAINSTDISSA